MTRTADSNPSGSSALNLPSAWNVVYTDDYSRSQKLKLRIPVSVAGSDGFRRKVLATPCNHFDFRTPHVFLKREHVAIQV